MTTRGCRATCGLALLILLSICSKALAVPASARQAVLELTPANTHIEYTLQGWPHITHGTFQLERGIIRIDPATGKADGSVIVSAASANSGSHMRDSETKASILDVQRYPEITFTPQQAAGQRISRGEFPATIRGILTLHGTSHEITLDTTIRPSADRFTATTHFTVPYVAWGLKDPSLLVFRCAKTVEVDVTTQGHVTWTPAGTVAGARAAAR